MIEFFREIPIVMSSAVSANRQAVEKPNHEIWLRRTNVSQSSLRSSCRNDKLT